jgi:hypothetical protein
VASSVSHSRLANHLYNLGKSAIGAASRGIGVSQYRNGVSKCLAAENGGGWLSGVWLA